MVTTAPHSDSHAALGVVEELARRFQAGDYAGAFALYHPALRIEQPASLPHGGVFEGHDGVRAMGALFGRFWDRTITQPRRMACDDGGVVQLTTQTWTAKSTGRSATVDVVELISLRQGLVSEIRVFQQDTQRLLATLTPAERPDGLAAHTSPWRREAGLCAVSGDTVDKLSKHWEDGWNREDVSTIVAVLHDAVRFSSPFAGRLGDVGGRATLEGIAAVRQYVGQAFERATPGIRYTLDGAYAGVDSVALAYTVHHPKLGERKGVDTMLLDAAGTVIEWRCHYPFVE